MKKCIYCLENEDTTGFTSREHVLPQSFGKFKANMTLVDKVCHKCNQKLGNELEIYLARDSYEGMSRYKLKVNENPRFKNLRLSISLAGGYLKGMLLYITYDRNTNKLVILPKNQIGFRRKDGFYEFFLFDNLPNNEFLNKNYLLNHEKGLFIPPGVDQGEAERALSLRNVRFKVSQIENLDFGDQEFLCEINGVIDKTIYRAIAKIGFNYLAYFNNSDLIFQDEFNVIRNFILKGKEPSYSLVRVDSQSILADEKISSRRSMHIITVNWAGDGSSILAKVSLFNQLTYCVCLSKNYHHTGKKLEKIGFGHYFDPHSKTIEKLGSTNIIIPKVEIIKPNELLWIPKKIKIF